jgi:phosphoglycolate phosphatase
MVELQWGDVVLGPVAGMVFDKDGTLAHSLPFLCQLADYRAQAVGDRVADFPKAELLAAWGVRAGQLDPTGLMAVGTRADNEVAAAAYIAAQGYAWAWARQIAAAAFAAADQHLPRKAQVTPPFPGCQPLLQRLQQLGIPVAVLSGDTTHHVQDFLAYHGLAAYVGWSQGSDGQWVKPDAALLHQACDRLNIPVAHTWVVGDAALDWELAHHGGAAGCLSVTWGGSPPIPAAQGVLNHLFPLPHPLPSDHSNTCL